MGYLPHMDHQNTGGSNAGRRLVLTCTTVSHSNATSSETQHSPYPVSSGNAERIDRKHSSTGFEGTARATWNRFWTNALRYGVQRQGQTTLKTRAIMEPRSHVATPCSPNYLEIDPAFCTQTIGIQLVSVDLGWSRILPNLFSPKPERESLCVSRTT